MAEWEGYLGEGLGNGIFSFTERAIFTLGVFLELNWLFINIYLAEKVMGTLPKNIKFFAVFV